MNQINLVLLNSKYFNCQFIELVGIDFQQVY
jgi:hypothetical protein